MGRSILSMVDSTFQKNDLLHKEEQQPHTCYIKNSMVGGHYENSFIVA